MQTIAPKTACGERASSMKDEREIRAKLNIIVSLASQVTAIACGLLIPRALLGAFGSEAYGACSSITQFLAYIALLEGGISGVARAALYKPLANNDMETVSRIIYQIKRFFRVIGYVFFGYVIILAVGYKTIAHVETYSWLFLAELVIDISISTFAQYFIGISYSVLLQAAQKIYVTYAISIITAILNAILVLVLIHFGCGLITVKFVSSLVFALRPLLLWLYVKKEFELVECSDYGEDMLSQRWTGLGQHIAFFLHSNTDIAVLTIFANLRMVAIYSVYNLVIASVQNLTASFATGVEAIFGDMLAKNERDRLNRTFDLYETLISVTAVVMFSTTISLVVPFVKLYTRNITDANYIQPLFAVILSMASLMYCLRQPYHSMVIAAGQFKQTRIGAYGEAVINIVLSITLIRLFNNLIGVAIGTLTAVTFRFVFYAFFLSKHVFYRKMSLIVKRFIVNCVSVFLCVGAGNLIGRLAGMQSYLTWFICACITALASLVIVCAMNYFFYPSDFKALLKKTTGRFG